jgi:hypothetical protein
MPTANFLGYSEGFPANTTLNLGDTLVIGARAERALRAWR